MDDVLLILNLENDPHHLSVLDLGHCSYTLFLSVVEVTAPAEPVIDEKPILSLLHLCCPTPVYRLKTPASFLSTPGLLLSPFVYSLHRQVEKEREIAKEVVLFVGIYNSDSTFPV